MEDVKLPDLISVRGSKTKRKLPSQASAEDTSNWDNRAIALPDPKRSSAQFILNDESEAGIAWRSRIHISNRSESNLLNVRNRQVS